MQVIYIGTGAYDTPAKDRSGNGNNLALTAVAPVNGKYGKEMAFNGVTSFAQASSPVIGTTGTIALRFKRGAVGVISDIVRNSIQANDRNGFRVHFSSANNLLFVVGDSSTTQAVTSTGLFSDMTEYHSAIISFSGTSIIMYIDGVLDQTIAQTVQIVLSSSTQNLLFGQNGAGAGFFNGIISHFRYDSRIWTADEARAWSLNPSVEDSLSMSETPSSGDVMVWPANASGTFTPEVLFGGGSTGITYSMQAGKYVRVGNVVYINIRVALTNKGSSTGVCTIKGAPFNCGSAQADRGVFTVITDDVTGIRYPVGYISKNSDKIVLYDFSSGASSVALTNANFLNTSAVILSGFYFV